MTPPAGCHLVCVPPDKVALAWPSVRSLIFAAMKRGDLSSFGPVEDSVLRGDALLWLALSCEDGDGVRIDAAAVTELHRTEWRKVCVVVACGAPSRLRASGRLRAPERLRAQGRLRAPGRLRPSSRAAASRAVASRADASRSDASRAAASRVPDMRRWLRLLEGIEDFARAEGCNATRIIGRQGWARVLTSYQTKRLVLEKDL
jgi:hypothetical protein